jgi:hydantoinase/carbamoylase family amidase
VSDGSAAFPALNAARVIAELRELDARSGGRRVAWTDVWAAERERVFTAVARELPGVPIEGDEAGNIWMVLPGGRPGRIIAGSHLDCVPEGGWLDGCLGVLAAIECARQLSSGPLAERRSFAVVDWADEEGARWGHSLLGSSAASGLLDVEGLLALKTGEGVPVGDLLRRFGVEPRWMKDASSRLRDADAYVELHIEQGPVLEALGRASAAVSGCLGVRRARLRFTGQAAHAGATPMDMRHDPAVAAARFLLGAREVALAGEGLVTVGSLNALPGTPTAVAEAVELVVDLRHQDRQALDRIDADIAGLAEAEASAARCGLLRDQLWSIDPVMFDSHLVAHASAIAGGEPLISGPLHDAAALALAGVPTAMVFVRTRSGISHSREEDASEEDLAVAIGQFGRLVTELVQGQSWVPPG